MIDTSRLALNAVTVVAVMSSSQACENKLGVVFSEAEAIEQAKHSFKIEQK